MLGEVDGFRQQVVRGMEALDDTIDEPEGGAHRDPELAAVRVKEFLVKQLSELSQLSIDELLAVRYQRLMSYGNP